MSSYPGLATWLAWETGLTGFVGVGWAVVDLVLPVFKSAKYFRTSLDNDTMYCYCTKVFWEANPFNNLNLGPVAGMSAGSSWLESIRNLTAGERGEDLWEQPYYYQL